MKLFNSCLLAVTFLALAAQANSPLAACGDQAAIKPAAASPTAAIPRRELQRKILKAWNDREERTRSLILLSVTNVTESRDRVRLKKLVVQARAPRRVASGKQAPLVSRAVEAHADGSETHALLSLFAMRGNHFRSEYWRAKNEQEARHHLTGLTPGKDSEYAVIEVGDRSYGLTPRGSDTAGTRFRMVTIGSNPQHIASEAAGLFFFLFSRSSLPAVSVRVPLESAKLTIVPASGQEPARVVASVGNWELWLDPSRDYLVTRVASFAPDGRTPRCVTEGEYEKVAEPIRWLPKKITDTWFDTGAKLLRRQESVTVDWATGDDKLPNELFEFDYPDGTMVLDSTDPNDPGVKCSIVWKGKLAPASMSRTYAESLERIKQGQPATPDGKK